MTKRQWKEVCFHLPCVLQWTIYSFPLGLKTILLWNTYLFQLYSNTFFFLKTFAHVGFTLRLSKWVSLSYCSLTFVTNTHLKENWNLINCILRGVSSVVPVIVTIRSLGFISQLRHSSIWHLTVAYTWTPVFLTTCDWEECVVYILVCVIKGKIWTTKLCVFTPVCMYTKHFGPG